MSDADDILKVKFGLAFQASQPDEHYLKGLRLAEKYGFEMVQVNSDSCWTPA
jgi:hypothetical protein